MSVVSTRSGAVRGITSDGVRVWRGIPYAEPPVGPLRWTAPQRESPWTGVRDASRFGHRAAQSPPMEGLAARGIGDSDTPTDEDCLYLNVCAPEDSGPHSRLPVVVWLHGGGYVLGSGAQYGDGAAVARANLVVVTVNFRLGALGMLDLSTLLGPREEASGTNTVRDQVAALRWVHENITAFGGDPANVTIQGLSAGAKSVANLMAVPAARGLFHRAISHSGGDHVASPAAAAELARRFTALLDLPGGGLARLRTVPTADLLAAQSAVATGIRATWVWRPKADGAYLPSGPTRAIAAGSAAGVALIAGTTTNEAGLFQEMDPTGVAQAPRIRGEIFGAEADRVAAAYADRFPELPPVDPDLAFMTDERYTAPTLRLADAQARHAPVWHYRFAGPSGTTGQLENYHGADLPYIWGLLDTHPGAEVAGLAAAYRDALAAFIRSGTPRTDRLPAWPAYETADRPTLVLGTPSRVARDGAAPPYPRFWADRAWEPGTWWPLGAR